MKTKSFLVRIALGCIAAFYFPTVTPVLSQDSDLLPGLCYSPFRDGQSPLNQTFPTEPEIIEDLILIKKITRVVRTYGIDTVLYSIPFHCHTLGINCWPGAWISSDTSGNRQQIERLIQIGQAGLSTTQVLTVGNEVLLFNTLPLETMLDYIDEVKQAVPLIPVSTSEPWHIWLNYPELAEACDILCVHVHPYWESVSAEEAAQYVYQKKQAVQDAYPDKLVVVTETGFPSSGEPNGAAIPSENNQAEFLEELFELMPENLFLFSFANEAWKIVEGSVGPHWGLYYSNRKPKPAMTQALSLSRIVFGSPDKIYTCPTNGAYIDSNIAPSLYKNGPATIRFSPNGNFISYKAFDGNHYIINCDTHEAPWVFAGKGRSERDQLFDPAGNAIYYGAYFSGIYQFVLKDSLNFPFCGTPNRTYPHEPVVSPDYKKVAYVIHSYEHNYKIYTRIRADASQQTELTFGNASHYDEKLDLQWLSNDKLIFKNANQQKIYLIDTTFDGYTIDPELNFKRIRVSPDKKYLAVFGGTSNLHFLSVDSLPETVHKIDMGFKAKLLAFSPNENYFAAYYNNNIRIFDFDTMEYAFLINQSFQGIITLDWGFGRDTINGQIHAGIHQKEFGTIRAYPNPTYSLLKFSTLLDRIDLFNTNGQRIGSKNETDAIDLSCFPSGLYFIRAQKKQTSLTMKIIKQ